MANIFQAKSREKTPIGGGEPARTFQFILNNTNSSSSHPHSNVKKKSEPRRVDDRNTIISQNM
jgi:hypothetical protein